MTGGRLSCSIVRIEYGMGRAGALPRVLGWTHPRLKTPWVAIFVQTGLSLAITLFAGLYWGATTSFGFLGFLIFHKDANAGLLQPSGIIGSIIGTIIVLLIWIAVKRRSGARA